MASDSNPPALLDISSGSAGPASLHRRFAVMDGLRGVAALCVVLFHSYEGGGIIPNGRLAVDLFFVLSGFVIAYSYGDRRPWSNRRFMIARFIRLYPMLFVGALGGAALALIHNLFDPTNAYPLGAIATSGGLSLLGLPYLDLKPFGDKAFSFNPPIWSLFFEVSANATYALLARSLSIRALFTVVIVAVASVVAIGSLGGGGITDFFSGFPRVAAGFYGGVLLFKLWQAGRLPSISTNIFLLSLVILALFAVPFKIGGWAYLPTFAILMVVVASSIDTRSARSDQWCEFLGVISYPIYLTHWLTLYVATAVGSKVGLTGELYAVVVLVHLLATPGVGFLVARYYETPVRESLKRLLATSRNRPAGL